MNESPLTRRESALVLAAVRYWQRAGGRSEGYDHALASHHGTLTPLSDSEVEEFYCRVAADLGGASPSRARKIPVCPECYSDDVAADAAARWCSEEQCWEVSTVFDKGHGCDRCEASDIEFAWLKFDDEGRCDHHLRAVWYTGDARQTCAVESIQEHITEAGRPPDAFALYRRRDSKDTLRYVLDCDDCEHALLLLDILQAPEDTRVALKMLSADIADRTR
jgi:hypothetical protein